MMLSRTCASPAPSSAKKPYPSGPRWRMAPAMRASAPRDTARSSDRRIPARPHMGSDGLVVYRDGVERAGVLQDRPPKDLPHHERRRVEIGGGRALPLDLHVGTAHLLGAQVESLRGFLGS